MELFRKFRFYILGGLVLCILIVAVALTVTAQSGRPTALLQATSTETVARPAGANPRPRAEASATPTAGPTIAPSPTKAATSMASPTPLPSATSAPLPSATATLIPLPTQAALVGGQSAQPTPTQPVMPGFTLLYLTQPAIAGVNAQATIQTVRGATCSISVYMPGENFPMVNGPAAMTAGVDGVCSWVWQVRAITKRGTGFVKISANGMNQTFNFTVQ